MRPVRPKRRLWAMICLAAAGAGGLACGGPSAGAAATVEDSRVAERVRMVREQIEARGIRDTRVLEALRKVPRHRFVPAEHQEAAYRDGPLPIGHGQTISQPYIVALMTSLIDPRPDMKVLEIGTGSGYQAAVLAELVGEVYTIEIIPELAARARKTLEDLGYENIHTRVGDGYQGWPEAAPFDAIVVTAAPPEIPQPLLDQLEVGGKLVIPVGRGVQDLVVVERTADGYRRKTVTGVRFVPMTGQAQEPGRP